MKLAILIFLLVGSLTSTAQQDTSAYQVQRKKVNQLLSDRSAKFGQYDQSLTNKTGIFGLKTKKDMQRSIDILTQIVLTDNRIFVELKTLLDYKDLEKTEAQGKFEETKTRTLNFMQTINNLQHQNDKLKEDLEKSVALSTVMYGILLILLVLGGTVIYLYRTKKLTFN